MFAYSQQRYEAALFSVLLTFGNMAWKHLRTQDMYLFLLSYEIRTLMRAYFYLVRCLSLGSSVLLYCSQKTSQL
jgi:hypothetical protein